TNRCSPRLTSCTSPSRSVKASRTNEEIAEIMLPTTSRSLSVISVRDMCLINSPFEPMTKTSSIRGSGVSTTAGSTSGGGGRAGEGEGDREDRIEEEGRGREEGEAVVRAAKFLRRRDRGGREAASGGDQGEDHQQLEVCEGLRDVGLRSPRREAGELIVRI